MRRLLLCLPFVVLLAACKSVRYVPVEVVRTDTLIKTAYQRDSVYLHDSIYTWVERVADTVFVTKYVSKTEYRDRWHTDTLREVKTDSVPTPYPIEVEVEKELNWWQKLRMRLGEVALMAALVLLGWGAIKIYRKWKRNI